MLAELYGHECKGCEHDHHRVLLGDLGDDSIDLSTVDFGAPQLPTLSLPPDLMPPTSFDPTSVDFSTPTYDLSYPNPDAAAFGVLPTALPPADIASAEIPLMPAPAPVSFPSSGPSTAAEVAAGAGAGVGILSQLKSIFTGGRPAPPHGYTYNATGQLVPMPMVAGVPTGGLASLSQLGSQLSSFVGTNWKWLALAGGGIVLVSAMSSRGGRRRR